MLHLLNNCTCTLCCTFYCWHSQHHIIYVISHGDRVPIHPLSAVLSNFETILKDKKKIVGGCINSCQNHWQQFHHQDLLSCIIWHLFPAQPCRGGLPRWTGPRCLPETARLRGVPNPGEDLPPRVSGQLPGGRRRTGQLLHPPPQQTQEIHLPVHWWLFFCSGGGESG